MRRTPTDNSGSNVDERFDDDGDDENDVPGERGAIGWIARATRRCDAEEEDVDTDGFAKL